MLHQGKAQPTRRSSRRLAGGSPATDGILAAYAENAARFVVSKLKNEAGYPYTNVDPITDAESDDYDNLINAYSLDYFFSLNVQDILDLFENIDVETRDIAKLFPRDPPGFAIVAYLQDLVYDDITKMVLEDVEGEAEALHHEQVLGSRRHADSPYATSAADDFIVDCTLKAVEWLRQYPNADPENAVFETVHEEVVGKPTKFLKSIADALDIDVSPYYRDARDFLKDIGEPFSSADVTRQAFEFAIPDKLVNEVARRVEDEMSSTGPLELAVAH